jgi:hypothetical protein
MVDDKDTDENPDHKVVSLAEQRERADDEAVEELEQLIDDGSRTLFRHRLGEVLDNICSPGLEGPTWIPAVAAGALGVAARDLHRIELPAAYRAAVLALRECDRIDECSTLANKAQALAGYARQVKDGELYSLAKRIHARAIRRCGELLKEIKTERGRRTDLEPQEGGPPKSTRTEFATDAGLSEHQRKTALRIANVSAAEFEEAVERERPPPVTALADRGRVGRPRSRWTPPERETVYVATEIRYAPQGSLAEIAIGREVAVLQAAWRDASPEARRRFLQNIGITV